MKKISVFLLFIATLFGAVFFNSCEIDEDDFLGPKNKWCDKDFSYKKEGSDETININTYMLYCDGTYTPKSTMVENAKFDFTKKGLYIVVKGSSTTTAIIANNKYAVLFLEEGKNISESIETSSDDDSGSSLDLSKFKLSSSMWTVICTLNPSITSSASTTVPDFLKSGSGYTDLTDYSSFSWKKILANIITDKLLE